MQHKWCHGCFNYATQESVFIDELVRGLIEIGVESLCNKLRYYGTFASCCAINVQRFDEIKFGAFFKEFYTTTCISFQ
jgi:hypothetical protein